MWIKAATKGMQSDAVRRLFCSCGKKLKAFISTSASTEDFVSNSHKGLGGKKGKQRFDAGNNNVNFGCRCCCLSSLSSSHNFPLTGYLLYRTHPAFKNPSSFLSLFKKDKRANNLPSPRFLSSTSSPEDQFQLAFRRECEKQQRDILEQVEENSPVTRSPQKRKLSLSPSASPQKSPEKKILKQSVEEEQQVQKTAKMVASPLKEYNSTDAQKTRTPVKESPAKRNLGFRDEAPVPKLQFAKLSDKAHVPTKGSKDAAGFDLKSAYDIVVPARGSALVKTDIQIKVPRGTYGRVAPRSGLALKHKLDVGAGVIDQDYRGNVGVILFNHGDQDFQVNEGDRIAQLICEKIEYPGVEEVQSLDETERGEGGFGSTGVKSN